MAELYRLRGDYEQAEQLHIQSLHIFEEIGQRHGCAFTKKSLAEIYHLRGDYERAEQLFNASFQTFLALGDRHSAAITLNNC